ncbi:hypothetical protein A7985_09135 [Pseudoalteromonas luteoviolacea]|uniref:Lipoprotein n=1 Tax=Pseudoalteromonas luteoviolacea TaxID=43657 RepID=A0A1C0TRT4_9GAMM|nr:hypothetical protein [Pseudoalteromonas luteoviolacea]OCQ21963.1 hypothetical protein A7985_09135 [Pseudoalteromonas luteoviolacea]
MITIKKTLGFFILLILSGCIDPKPQLLINGYHLSSTNASNTYVTKGYEVIIHSDVLHVEVVEHFIIGKRQLPEHPDHNELDVAEGYFIIDTKNGEVSLGVDKSTILKSTNGKYKIDW